MEKRFPNVVKQTSVELTDIDGPRISRKSILRNRSHRTSSSTDGYRLSGDSNIICSTSTTYVSGESILGYCTFQFQHCGKYSISEVGLSDHKGTSERIFTLCSAYIYSFLFAVCFQSEPNPHSENELFEQIITMHVLQMMLILHIPVDIAPSLIASDPGWDVAMVIHNPCTFQIANDQSK